MFRIAHIYLAPRLYKHQRRTPFPSITESCSLILVNNFDSEGTQHEVRGGSIFGSSCDERCSSCWSGRDQRGEAGGHRKHRGRAGRDIKEEQVQTLPVRVSLRKALVLFAVWNEWRRRALLCESYQRVLCDWGPLQISTGKQAGGYVSGDVESGLKILSAF